MSHRRFGKSFIAASAALTLAFTATVSSAADTLITLDGEQLSGKINTISENGEVAFGNRSISLQDLRRIDRQAGELDALPLRVTRLFLTDGSVIIAKKLKIEDETVTFDLAEGKAQSLPLTSLRGVVFMPLGADESGNLVPDQAFARMMADETDRQDTLFVIKDDTILTVRGALEAAGAEQVTFVWNDRSRKLELSKLYGMTIAAPATPPSVVGQAKVQLKGGSTLWTTPVLKGDQIVLTRTDGLELTVPWERIIRMHIRSRRMAFLSELKPASIRTQPIAAPAYQPMMDRSVMAGPIQIGQRTFERGIGAHAYTRMTWQIEGGYDVMAGVIGIDESVGDRGNCIVRILADDRELFSKQITGADQPVPVKLAVSGAEELTLIVEPGEGLDLGDHVNFGDARLIKDE